jgi:hypothetical protein
MMDKDADAVNVVVDQIQRYLAGANPITLSNGMVWREPLAPVTCDDGTVFSIQAGEYLYCTPRDNNGPWTHVEVMTIFAETDPVHWEHGDDFVGGYVPIEDVAREIISRGGAQF